MKKAIPVMFVGLLVFSMGHRSSQNSDKHLEEIGHFQKKQMGWLFGLIKVYSEAQLF